MRKTTFKTLMALFAMAGLLLSTSVDLPAQEEDAGAIYFQFDYMKSKNGDYVAMERELWKPVHQQRIKDGKLLWWGLYSVNFPSGTMADYDYVTINVYDSPARFEDGYSELEKWMKAAHPDKDFEKMGQRTTDSRDIVWSEVFELIDRAVGPQGKPAKYLVANRMKVKPGEGQAYVEMERKGYMPAHKMAVDKGLRENWWLLGRTLPYGASYGYNFMTLDAYDSMQQVLTPLPADFIAEATKAMDARYQDMDPNSVRELSKADLWQLLDHSGTE